MQRKEAISFIFKVILLGLAILLLIFGLYPKLLNGENQEMYFVSPEGKSMPEEGFETEMISGLSYVTVQVDADENVEVHMYVSTYRGGKVIKDENNDSVIRDEWLAAGEKDERIGRNIKLSDFTAYPAHYRVRVVEPEGSIPSDVAYEITIKAYTVDMTLIIAGLLFYAIFIFLGIFEYLSSINRSLKSGVAMMPAEAAEASDLEALLEPAAAAPAAMAAAPMAMAAEPAPPTAAPTSYEPALEQPMAPPPPAPYAAAPPMEAPAAYAPPPPPEVPPPPAVPPAAPAYQAPPQAAPAPYAPPPAPVAAPAPAAAPEAVSKVRCPACKSIVPVYTNERPTPIECPTCGKKGMIR